MLPPSSRIGLGRGQQKLADILSSLELPSDCMHDPFGSSTTALPVDPKRVSLPTQVGQCQPERWLPPELAWPFTHPERLVLPEELWPDPLPRACHMISVEDELELAARLLDLGMAVLVPENSVATDGQGRLLLAGWFSVLHKATSDRLILDRRPLNATEVRVRPVRWPLGYQLALLCIKPWQNIAGRTQSVIAWAAACLAHSFLRMLRTLRVVLV